jgi:hypothetical protein
VFGPNDGGQEAGGAAEPVVGKKTGETIAALKVCTSFLLENSDFMFSPLSLQH